MDIHIFGYLVTLSARNQCMQKRSIHHVHAIVYVKERSSEETVNAAVLFSLNTDA